MSDIDTTDSEVQVVRCTTVHDRVAEDVADAYKKRAVVDLGSDQPANVEQSDDGNPKSWSTPQVARWFQTIGCSEYSPLVVKEDLDGQLLVLLGDQELKDFGIQNSFHRKKILVGLSKLKSASGKRKRDSHSAGSSGAKKIKKSSTAQIKSAGKGGAVSSAAEADDEANQIVDWGAVQKLVGKDETEKMKQGDTFSGSLDFENKTIKAEGCQILAPALCRMTGLTELNLINTKIADEGIILLTPAFSKMTKLDTLRLSKNKIGPKGIVSLCNALLTMQELRYLWLYQNQVGDQGAVHLFDALRKLKKFYWLDLGTNNIGDRGAISFSKALPEMKKIYLMTFWNNHIKDDGVNAITNVVKSGKAPSLGRVWLHYNKYSETAKNKLKKEWVAQGKVIAKHYNDHGLTIW